MKKIITLMAALMVFLCTMFGLNAAVGEDLDWISNHIYGRLAIVTDLDFDEDLVSVKDWCGLVWQFYGIEDWNIGDFVNLILYDNLTEDSIFDDLIIRTLYERVDLVSQWGL